MFCVFAHVFFKVYFFLIYLFLRERDRERERETASAGEGQREGESISSRLCTVSIEPNMGLDLEIESQVLN